MDRIDPYEFVQKMLLVMTLVKKHALKMQKNAVTIYKNKIINGVEHEQFSTQLIGVLSRVDLDIQEILLQFIFDTWSPAMIVHHRGRWLSDWQGLKLKFSHGKRIPNILFIKSKIYITDIIVILKMYTTQSMTI